MLLRRSLLWFHAGPESLKQCCFSETFRNQLDITSWFVGIFLLGCSCWDIFLLVVTYFFSIDFGVPYLGRYRYVILTKMDFQSGVQNPDYFHARRLFPAFQSAWEDFGHTQPDTMNIMVLTFDIFSSPSKKNGVLWGWLPGWASFF